MDIEADAGEPDKVHSSKTKQRNTVDSITEQISGIAISESPATATPSTNAANNLQTESSVTEIDKKIRALKKKVLPPSLAQSSVHACVCLKNVSACLFCCVLSP